MVGLEEVAKVLAKAVTVGGIYAPDDGGAKWKDFEFGAFVDRARLK